MYNKIIIIFLIIINLINYVNGQDVYKLFNLVDSTELIKSPLMSSEKVCYFKIPILVVNDFNSSGVPFPYIYKDSIEFGNFLNKNSTSALFDVTYTTVFGNSSSIISLDRNDLSLGSIVISTNCKAIEVDSLSVEVFNDKLFYSPFTKFVSIVKLSGLEYDISLRTTDLIKVDKLSNGYYMFQFNLAYYEQQISNDWNVSIIFPDKLLNFTVHNLIDVTNNNRLYEITTYPSDVSVYKLMGINAEASFTFRTTSKNQYPVFILKSDLPDVLPRPFSGAFGNITYIASLPTFFGESPTLFKLLSQNDTSLVESYSLTSSSLKPDGLSNTFASTGMVLTFDNSSSEAAMMEMNLPNCFNYSPRTYQYYFEGASSFTNEFTFPFAFIGGTNFNYTLGLSFYMPRETFLSTKFGIGDILILKNQKKDIPVVISNGTYNEPLLKSLHIVYLGEFKYLLTLDISSVTNFKSMKFILFTTQQIVSLITAESIISGDLNNGVYEFISNGIEENELMYASIETESGEQIMMSKGNPFSASAPYQNLELPVYKTNKFNYSLDINSVTFKYQNVHVTNQTVANIMYFNLSNYEGQDFNKIEVALQLLDPKSINDKSLNIDIILRDPTIKPVYLDSYFSKWNTASKLFEIKFFIPANTIPGPLSYRLVFDRYSKVYSQSLTSEFQLNLISKNIDIQGPIFTNILKYQGVDAIGWTFTIEDEVNGFDHGFITVMGSVDSSVYNFTLTLANVINGDSWKGEYQIKIKNIDSRCITQDYIITRVVLLDKFSNCAKFTKYITSTIEQFSFDSSSNPFINYINDSNINIVSFVCANPLPDSLLPDLISFNSSKQSVDVGSLDRMVIFQFEATAQSGLKQGTLPILYLSDNLHKVIECTSSLKLITEFNAVYNCSIELPVGFGFPSGVLISVYGFINNGGYYSGFSSAMLRDKGFSWFIDTSEYSLTQPIIQSTNSFSNQGGDLLIKGRFSSASSIFIKYLDEGLNSEFISCNIGTKYGSTMLLLTGIRETNQSIILKASTSSNIQSNELIVHPVLYFFNYSDPIEPTLSPEPTETPTNSQIPTLSPIPTNPPQNCLGNPQCGGPSQGYCQKGVGCICYSPYVGTSCSGQVIIVPTPTINTTDPSTEIPIPPKNTSDASSLVLYKSLISLVSLREVDFAGNEVKTFPFSNWIYTPLSSSKSTYVTSIKTSNDNQEITTNITATLEWFKDQTNISFANQQLTMHPSSVKYTIEIGSYAFSSALNQLQLVMSASLISSKTDDICSSKVFGNTTRGDDSNYVKIQVEDHAIYGRFIKRCIVDGVVKSVDNELLDSSMNTISNAHSSQSFIGITMSAYKNNITIDPDFSVIIDHNSSDDDNSICNKSKSGLSKGQLAGIIVGAVAFGAVVIICVSYFIYKKKADAKWWNNSIGIKLSNINKK